MKRLIVLCLAVLAGSAFAQGTGKDPKAQGGAAAQPGQAGGMDMSKMGPWTRKPTNEAKTKKEINDFFKQEEELMKKGDMEAMFGRIDFPVYMLTDDSKGMTEAKEFSKQEYTEMMKPFYENAPKDMKTTHKTNITLLSDNLAVVTDDFTMTMGKQKMSGKSASMLVKKDGQWKWKVMSEAGWGGMGPGTGGSDKSGTRK